MRVCPRNPAEFKYSAVVSIDGNPSNAVVIVAPTKALLRVGYKKLTGAPINEDGIQLILISSRKAKGEA